MIRCILILTLIIFSISFSIAQPLYRISNGTVRFASEAPLENITASSRMLRGVVDISKNTFAFTLNVNSLKGFNSPLQQEHFYENYMETDEFPTASFSGKIIEEINYNVPGIYEVRAKGMLNIHGVKQDRIIKVKLDVASDQIKAEATFEVELKDHDIKVPRIVNQKIAPVIKVSIDALLLP